MKRSFVLAPFLLTGVLLGGCGLLLDLGSPEGRPDSGALTDADPGTDAGRDVGDEDRSPPGDVAILLDGSGPDANVGDVTMPDADRDSGVAGCPMDILWEYPITEASGTGGDIAVVGSRLAFARNVSGATAVDTYNLSDTGPTHRSSEPTGGREAPTAPPQIAAQGGQFWIATRVGSAAVVFEMGESVPAVNVPDALAFSLGPARVPDTLSLVVHTTDNNIVFQPVAGDGYLRAEIPYPPQVLRMAAIGNPRDYDLAIQFSEGENTFVRRLSSSSATYARVGLGGGQPQITHSRAITMAESIGFLGWAASSQDIEGTEFGEYQIHSRGAPMPVVETFGSVAIAKAGADLAVARSAGTTISITRLVGGVPARPIMRVGESVRRSLVLIESQSGHRTHILLSATPAGDHLYGLCLPSDP